MEAVKFTANEIAVLKAIRTINDREREGCYSFLIEDIVSIVNKTAASVKSTLGSLTKKGMVSCYAGEAYCDGNTKEEMLNLFEQVTDNNTNPQNNETENDMENNENPMMDERIIRLNEIISTKLSSVSKGKRERIKANKAAAKVILENWNKVEALEYLASEEFKENYYELYCIVKSRIDQLNYAAAEAAKAEERITDEEVVENNDETTSETTPAAAETSKTDKTTADKKTARSKHVIGDFHPNGKWVWTEYKPGKFDWRGIPKNGTTPKPPKEKTATGSEKIDEKPIKVRSIEEILAIKPQGISKPQERVFKLLRKGYRIDPNAANPQGYTLIKDGKTMVIIEGVMNALLNRMKVTPDEINQLKA